MTNRKKILFVTSECVPFCKSGGLADVSGALPEILKDKNAEVKVVLPRYWSIDKEKYSLKTVIPELGVPMGSDTLWCSVLSCVHGGVEFYFIEYDGLYFKYIIVHLQPDFIQIKDCLTACTTV